jgi:hypothetical protein
VGAALRGQLSGVFARFLKVRAVRMAAFFSTELPRGTTMRQGTPWLRAAQPMLWPWLPRVALMTLAGMPVLRRCSK